MKTNAVWYLGKLKLFATGGTEVQSLEQNQHGRNRLSCRNSFIKLFLKFFCCCSCTVVSIFLPPLSPQPPIPTSYPPSFPYLALSMCPLHMLLDDLFSSFLFPLVPSPLVTVSLFFIFMSLVICCLLVCFVDQVPLISEIIWYLSFTTWLTSLRL